MHRGYLKFWRRAEDSRVWSRGIEYRGLLITLLARASYCESSFCGETILPGQVAVSVQRLADDLGISRDKLNRMLATLRKDGVISHNQSRTRFSVITILNYGTYQEIKSAGRAASRTADHPSAAQQAHILEESKNLAPSSLCSEGVPPPVRGGVDDAGAGEAQAGTAPSQVTGQAPGQATDQGPPVCRHQQVIAVYRELLPTLPVPRVWDEERQRQLRTRWREAWERLKKSGRPHGEAELLAWWRAFFATVNACPWLMGQVAGRDGRPAFLADLVWLTRKRNFAKVIDGNYLPRKAA